MSNNQSNPTPDDQYGYRVDSVATYKAPDELVEHYYSGDFEADVLARRDFLDGERHAAAVQITLTPYGGYQAPYAHRTQMIVPLEVLRQVVAFADKAMVSTDVE